MMKDRANQKLTAFLLAVILLFTGMVPSVSFAETDEILDISGNEYETEERETDDEDYDDNAVLSEQEYLGIFEGSYGETDDGFNYILHNDGTAEIYGYAGAGKNIEIPAYVNGAPVSAVGEYAFSGYSDSNITTVIIPSTVKVLEYYAFFDNKTLKKVEFEEGSELYSILDSSFRGCTNLESINIPNKVTDLQYGVFADCINLNSVNFDEGSSLYNIKSYAFGNCRKLSSIDIPGTVTRLEYFAFYNSGLESIDLPDKAEVMDFVNTFDGCSDLKSINASDQNRYYSSNDGVIFSKDGTSMYFYPQGKKSANGYYRIPDGVNNILNGAFKKSPVKSLGIPASVFYIGDGAFTMSSSLKDVYYSSSKSNWDRIRIYSGNDSLINASIHYNSIGPDDTKPDDTKPDDTKPDNTKPDDTTDENTVPHTVTSLEYATEYIPYYMTLNTEGTASIESGTLPEGITLDSTGELHGIAMKAGNYRFTVKITENGSTSNIISCTLFVNDNTNVNVNMSTSEGVNIIDPVNNMTLSALKDQIFEIDGPAAAFSDFKDLYLDGKKLLRGDVLEGDVDYTAEEGSTKITIASKTFKDAGTGTHTIVAEFKNQTTGKYSYASQNYTVTKKKSRGGGGSSLPDSYTVKFEEYGGNSVADITVSRGAAAADLPMPVRGGYIFDGWCTDTAATKLYNGEVINKNTTLYAKWTKRTVPLSADEFSDVNSSDWFYKDVDWAYKSELMKGTGNQIFAPASPISKGMAVTVLARISLEDMSKYNADDYAEIESGNWYSTEAAWARVNNIIDGEFKSTDGSSTATRGELAVMLKKYLDHMKIKYSKAPAAVNYDESQMTSEEKEAFNVLVNAGIFRGRGDNTKMDPNGITSRAELAALLHRVADYA